jgi:hypothetical protein
MNNLSEPCGRTPGVGRSLDLLYQQTRLPQHGSQLPAFLNGFARQMTKKPGTLGQR